MVMGCILLLLLVDGRLHVGISCCSILFPLLGYALCILIYIVGIVHNLGDPFFFFLGQRLLPKTATDSSLDSLIP